MKAQERWALVDRYLRWAFEALEREHVAIQRGNVFVEGIEFGMALASYSAAAELADAVWSWPMFHEWAEWAREAIRPPVPAAEASPSP